ncbi:MAG: hypothetical protein KDE47_34625, partial [Caldilineaceae bacterium]|nr:hypothetical protein [Caldilineaceae bacterium]
AFIPLYCVRHVAIWSTVKSHGDIQTKTAFEFGKNDNVRYNNRVINVGRTVVLSCAPGTALAWPYKCAIHV